MLRRSGVIPKAISYIVQPASKTSVGTYYDRAEGKHINAHKISVTDSVKAVASNAKNVVSSNNLPIKNAKIINQHHILIDGKYLAESNPDLLSDLMINSKIAKGEIKDNLIWCKVHGKLQLVRQNSSLHKQIMRSEDRRSMKKIKNKDLEIGGIYSTPAGKLSIYLGKVDTHVAIIDYKDMNSINTYFAKNNKLFYQINDCNVDFSTEDLDKWRMSLKSSHSFVEKVKAVSVPNNAIDQIRSFFMKKFREYLVKYSKESIHSQHEYVRNAVYWEYRSVCPYLSMVKSGEPPADKFDLAKYLMLS